MENTTFWERIQLIPELEIRNVSSIGKQSIPMKLYINKNDVKQKAVAINL